MTTRAQKQKRDLLVAAAMNVATLPADHPAMAQSLGLLEAAICAVRTEYHRLSLEQEMALEEGTAWHPV